MSDTGLDLITINRALRIIIAGKHGRDPVAGMVTHVFNIAGIDFEYEPEYSGLNDLKADIAVLTVFLSDNMKSLSAAREACLGAGVGEDDFYESMKSYK